MNITFPECKKCGNGVLLPLSDYGKEGSTIVWKAWVCSNSDCGFGMRIDNGVIGYTKIYDENRRL